MSGDSASDPVGKVEAEEKVEPAGEADADLEAELPLGTRKIGFPPKRLG